MRHIRIRRIGGLLGLTALIAAQAFGPSARAADDGLRATFEARYGAMKAAMAASDGSAAAAILSPDFVSVDVSGATGNAQEKITEINAMKPDPDKVSNTTILGVDVQGKTAIVDKTFNMKTKRRGADGVDHSVEIMTRSTDTWINVANNWLMLRSVIKEMSMATDGKQTLHKVQQ